MKKNKHKILALIPARMGSSRFPGKPLAKILDKPMIGHVYDRIKTNNLISNLYVATCDHEIFNYIESIGGCAIMTSKTHERASDRCAEALLKVEKKLKIKFDFVVMIQGDEPMTHPEMINQALEPLLKDKNILVSNLMGKIESEEEFNDKNCIKVVCDLDGFAIYFSREPIPTSSKVKDIEMYKQICIIPFKRDFLLTYNKLEPTPLEIAESIDMLRIIEFGKKVKMIKTNYKTHAVDTPKDLEKVSSLIKNM
jgi:3-deoxy-manno-octulosonate cytidylyltransferase (CMP-KDO synthetase)